MYMLYIFLYIYIYMYIYVNICTYIYINKLPLSRGHPDSLHLFKI